MLAAKWNYSEIAKILGRDRSTISREVGKGGCNKYTYRAVKADKRAKRRASRRKLGKRRIIQKEELKHYVLEKLKLRWSPEQIAERLEKDYPDSKEICASRRKPSMPPSTCFPKEPSRKNCFPVCAARIKDAGAARRENKP